ncbi:condensation domain-containing protein [Albimonas pacifica]|uniref:Phosphopantetheine attachment site n=1 Tax=Albimonas pacifica TaxID=1114924 RepID=A0A1I3DAN6_9RHOB|nr:condensation domain-containing protein [Albimonas pacifica]SFH83797.1 Phosphopantetheine attachment site [Albimonas pacifica]
MSDAIQDVYPLAPGQGGILFQSLGEGAEGSGAYVVQVVLHLRGEPDRVRERAAWDALVARHDALRTALVWRGRARPLQVVGRRARAPFALHDLTDLPQAERAPRVAAFLAEDRARGFDLSRAPLLRLARFRLGGGEGRLVASFHHAVLDGWSAPVLLREWLALYAGRPLPPARPFREHVAWALSQDRAAALAFWRAELADRAPAAVWTPPPPAAPPAARRGDLSLDLDAAQTQALRAAARRAGVTLAVAAQGAWALTLSRLSGSRDVVWGLARSGRSAALAGVESRAGMFLTTLPMRAQADPDRPLADWLGEIQARLSAQGPHEHLPLGEVQAAVGRPDGGPLLTSAVVFENYPTDPALLGEVEGFAIEAAEVREQTSLPLTLFAAPHASADGQRLRLRLLFDAALVDEAVARLALSDAARVLATLAEAPRTRLGEIALEAAPLAAPRAPAPPLSKPLGEAPQAAVARLLPRLAALWAELLEGETPEAEDNFFALGGHSLLTLRLQERIRADLGIEVAVPDLFRFATLAAQSRHLAALRVAAETPDRPDGRAQARLQGAARLRRRRAQTAPNGARHA